MEEWRIHKDRSRCEVPGCPLAGEQEYYAILQLPECLRLERCTRCFTEWTRGGVAMPFHWKVRRNPAGSPQPSLDLESLRQLFDTLGEVEAAPVDAPPVDAAPVDAAPVEAPAVDARPVGGAAADRVFECDPAAQARTDAAGLRYLVALLLLRKRRLKMVDPQTPEQEAADLLVVDPRVDGMAPVALFAPELDSDRLQGLREELMAALGDGD